MADSVLIERPGALDEDLSTTAISDLPMEPTRDDDVPPVGSILDERYEITGLLGQGGMGHVLGARHVVLKQRLAIKVLRREMTRDGEIVERFRREAKAASAIGHTGIVAVKDFGSLPSGASYYVMEHVDGESLADVLAHERQLPIARAVDVVGQMADALGAAHAAGVVHRDVKPENVLLTSFHGRADHVKILDFGIAKLDFASRLSSAHRVLGTPAYMSPEQARGQTLDQRCDVYALGIVFYELLAGDVPFDDKRPLEVLRKQIHTPAPSVRLLRPDVPEELASLIASCLEKSPDARPSTMKAFAERLASFVPSRAPAPSAAPAARPARRPALPSMAVAPLSSPSAVPSRATPVSTARASTPGSSRTWLAALAVGVALSVLGVIALAAAGGIVAREHADQARTIAAPALPALPMPAVAAAPPVVPTTVAAAPVPSSIAVAPPVTATTAAHPIHAPHPSTARVVAAAETPVEAAPVAPAPPPTPAHSAIRVIDPWDQP